MPTDQQWQRAAQGDTNRVFPYGDTFDSSRCNVDTKGTTAVTQYEGEGKGDSPFGVVDMSGNVFEWCLTTYDKGTNGLDETNGRVLRGGSFGVISTVTKRADFRARNSPEDMSTNWGFRIARN